MTNNIEKQENIKLIKANLRIVLQRSKENIEHMQDSVDGLYDLKLQGRDYYKYFSYVYGATVELGNDMKDAIKKFHKVLDTGEV